MFHRSIEHEVSGRALAAIFADEACFAHHPTLPSTLHFGDEGAANHNRFCMDHGDGGVELFVYGRQAFGEGAAPQKFPARQTLEASTAVARLHGLSAKRTAFVQQSPAVIDAGAFHNDVVAVVNKNVFLYHQMAFDDPQALKANLQALAPEIAFEFIEISTDQLPISDAIKSYLFNSQLISRPQGGMALVLPREVEENDHARTCVNGLIGGNHPIEEAIYLDVRQSMRNGGGPACLRLRVVLSEAERGAIGANAFMTDALFGQLTAWVEQHYRDRLLPEDLGDPALLDECRTALDELSQILAIGSIYDFQR